MTQASGERRKRGLKALWIGLLVVMFVSWATQSLAALNDTGQTLCYDGARMVSCTEANTGDASPYPRQDGRYGRDAQAWAGQLTKVGGGVGGFDFTPLDSGGNPIAIANGIPVSLPTCTRDNVTGLTWEVKTNDGGLRSNYWTYTWYSSDGNVGTSNGGTCYTSGRCDTEKYVEDVNATGLCGHHDWRLPTVKELLSIAWADRQSPDYNYFPNTAFLYKGYYYADYWSATINTVAGWESFGPAWEVQFWDGGYSWPYDKSAHVILVRGQQVLPDTFTDHGNGTVTQNSTGLMWAKCSEGQSGPGCELGSPTLMTWGQALTSARNSRLAGYSDWRLPNKNELGSLVDFSIGCPTFNTAYFPNTNNTGVQYWWTSTSWLSQWPENAYFVSLCGQTLARGKSNTEAVRLVRSGQSFDAFSGSGYGGVSATPEQPVYSDPPPPVTVPPGVKKHLVLLIHGWNSNPSVWADAMKESIKKTLPGYTGQEGCKEGQTIEDTSTNTSWQVCTLDWSQLAGDLSLKKGPWFAYDNARIVGQSLAKAMVDKQLNYDFIHFIAHSAGSQVADTVATQLPRFINDHNAQSGDHVIKPIIHTTFLDAYDPSTTLLDSSPYGMSSDWAEQYVDMRRVGVPVLDDTNLTLAGSYNIDITALDPNGNNVTGTDAHAWPYEWYEETVKDPTSSTFGFNLSRESGRDQFPTNLPKGGKCIFTPAKVCSGSGVVAVVATVKVVIDDMADPIASALASATGSIVFLSDQLIKITTGSPAWVSLPINVPEPIDVLTFDYTYQRQAEGLLSVFFDDQLVFRSDQRVEPSGLNHSDNVPIGTIASGAHTLSFRLDAFNNTQSEIDISRIQLGKMEVSEQVDITPPVITPTVSGTVGSNGWYTNDVMVSWTVVDSESAIATQSGCGTTSVTTDTSGVTFTCSATSGGGPTSKSVTIQRDATVPTIAGSVSPAANANGWRNSAVAVSFTCTDATSGIATCTAPQTLGEGASQSVSGAATDKAGNAASTSVTGINVDLTAPTVSVTGVVNGASYLLGSIPAVGCDTKDVLSGVQINATPSVTGGDSRGVGTLNAHCTGAMDKAGNAGAVSVTYQVTDTPPSTSSTFSTFSVNPLRINQRLKTLFLLSNFTLGQNSNGIDPAKEAVTLTIAGFTATIPPGSFRKGPAGVYAFAGKIDGVSIEALIAPLGNNRFGFQVAAYGVSLSGTKNPVSVTLMIGDDSGTTTVNNAIIR